MINRFLRGASMEIKKRPTACVLIIGNEILSGRTQDVNLNFLATSLTNLGIQLVEARVIADVESAIVSAVNGCRELYDYVFTTGGIGPTHKTRSVFNSKPVQKVLVISFPICFESENGHSAPKLGSV